MNTAAAPPSSPAVNGNINAQDVDIKDLTPPPTHPSNQNGNNTQQQSPPQQLPPKPEQTVAQWTISNYSQQTDKFYTNTAQICGLTWRLYIFPKGNTSNEDLSLFLDLVEIKQPNFPCQKVNFMLELVNQKKPEESVRKPSDHIFSAKFVDWGFNKFIKISTLLDPKNGFIVDDTLILRVEILNIITETISANGQRAFLYNSKKMTGFVGLKNQGATCYMNSLLQALYQISPFRRAVYELPTAQNDDPHESIPLALQRLFYKLQFGSTTVSTKELTKSFGWGTHDIFTQHDVQELNRVLCDNLNDKMKGTKSEGTIDNLFRGKIKNFIKCEKVKYESKREEEFYDLSLNVKGCPTIQTSFEKYTEIEKLDGNNMYDAEGFGLQVANKGCRFLSFPPVLHLQLKRFEYDPMRDANVKVNDRYTFPEQLDLSPYLDEEADKTTSSIYNLQGVLIHSGDLHNGHYYAFMKPKKDGDWLKFDDEEVSRCSLQQVTEESFGTEVESVRRGGAGGFTMGRSFTNAYMLVYIRSTEIDELLKPIPDSEIPVHLKQRLDSDEKTQTHQMLRIKMTTDEDFVHNTGFDLVDLTKLPYQNIIMKPGENYNIAYLKRQITTIIGVPPERQRLWSWSCRRNRTMRIDMVPEQDDASLKRPTELAFYLEVSYVPRTPNMGASYFQPIDNAHSNALLFFKYHDPEQNTMKFVGSKVIDISCRASYIHPMLRTMAGLPADTPLLLFEEISPGDIEVIKPSEFLRQCELATGDIIVFQKHVSIKDKHMYPTAVEYFTYVTHKTVVKFQQVDNSNVNFTLELVKNTKYSEITKIIGQQIKVDYNKIRLLAVPRFAGMEPYSPVKPNDNIPLCDILNSNNRLSDKLFFEVLNIPVSECESKSNFRITWQKPSFEYEQISLWVTKQGTVHDIKQTFIELIQSQSTPVTASITIAGGVSTPPAGQTPTGSPAMATTASAASAAPAATATPVVADLKINELKLLEIRSHRIVREFCDDERLSIVMENANLKMEAMSEDEINKAPTDKVVTVVHFSNEAGFPMYHGVPFQFVIKEGENYQSLRSRIQARLGPIVSPAEFARWKLAIIQDDKVNPLTEDATISKGGDWSHATIGLQHNPSVPMRGYQQRAIKINK
ncbi:hypothetical protein SAMD00019534_082800 [Acytostelium subglobosum LB1]|uniref:hypothetical protein n=1 Tax=Acytostelium subglobosum LB1 TaxID=1410327 RepID=UPI000644A231|nr:hypothetical protein SAMD00019534_082800 [Acytostelium subglobosum LB1]GAM25105.1 hypothetical protein SAMD00019534_082800 [Acytostelium subglobosum LB1]|eukprot:XP_012752194.1 hypothetical protein SAMD00019534_082800 [Acytostelium subglobosum LB1]